MEDQNVLIFILFFTFMPIFFPPLLNILSLVLAIVLKFSLSLFFESLTPP